ncbi:hypothetical protein [Streptomyces cellulosae]|uniref:hypothetical protein n=1 Tax=Streptomyces cellulosae TaxID=1968 RepID=UPI00099D4477|nr:hypothetical protein [Streptomyces cellulosae]
MAVLAVIIPLLMLGVVLALGRYEELLLPGDPGDGADRPEPAVAPSAATPVTSAVAPVARATARAAASAATPVVGRKERVQSAWP